MEQSDIKIEPVLREDQYYTDGHRLYRVIQINWKKGEVVIENCSTLYLHNIEINTVIDSWTEVNPYELCA